MSHKNKDVNKHKGEFQSKEENQAEVRSDYTGFNNVLNRNKINLFKNNSDLVNKNTYMRYELNNTFKDKDDKKNK